MDERWVLDASPLISLCDAGHGDWFGLLAAEVAIPAAVAREVAAGPDDVAGRMVAAGQFTIVPDVEIPAAVLSWDLGAGESAVLAWALRQPGWTAILDDGHARRCARTLGIAARGTLGAVVLARRHGLCASAAAVVRDLRASGLRLDEELVRLTLWEALGEHW